MYDYLVGKCVIIFKFDIILSLKLETITLMGKRQRGGYHRRCWYRF